MDLVFDLKRPQTLKGLLVIAPSRYLLHWWYIPICKWKYVPCADPGIFVRGGVQPSRKILTRKKKRHKGEGEGGGVSIYSASVWSKSIFAIETALQTNNFYKYDIPQCFFFQAETHLRSLFWLCKMCKWCHSGNGTGGPPPETVWFKWCKIV